MYSGYLKTFRKKNSGISNSPYKEQLKKILFSTSEPIGSYTRMFNSLDIETESIITNADFLQNKWRIENEFPSISNRLLVVEQVKKFKPDVLWIEGNDYVEKSWIDLVRKEVPSIKLVFGNHCAPYNSGMLAKFKNLDFIITCTPGIKIDLENNGIKTFLVYHAFDPFVLTKIGGKKSIYENDFIFSGSLFTGGGFHDKRIQFLENILKQNIDLKIYGNLEKRYKTRAKQFIGYILKLLNYLRLEKLIRKVPLFYNHIEYSENRIRTYSRRLVESIHSPVFGDDMYTLLSKSKITLNIHGDVAGEFAGNVRLFEATGVGSCLLTDNKKNLVDLFDTDKEIVVYNGIDDCIEKIQWLLKNEETRKIIAAAGQKRTLTNHSVESRCKKIIDIINNELDILQQNS